MDSVALYNGCCVMKISVEISVRCRSYGTSRVPSYDIQHAFVYDPYERNRTGARDAAHHLFALGELSSPSASASESESESSPLLAEDRLHVDAVDGEL